MLPSIRNLAAQYQIPLVCFGGSFGTTSWVLLLKRLVVKMDQRKPPNPCTLLFRLVFWGSGYSNSSKNANQSSACHNCCSNKRGYSTLAKQGTNMHKHRKDITNSKNAAHKQDSIESLYSILRKIQIPTKGSVVASVHQWEFWCVQ